MSNVETIKIAVIGANGQLGQTFRQISGQYKDYIFDFFDKDELNLLDKNVIDTILNQKNYHYIINCAAYTAVDKAESEPELCYAINARACEYITEAIEGKNVRLIHFSTDYVYHQYDGFPLKEHLLPKPQGIYAKSKLEGENIIRKSGIPALIIRTSWVISPFGHNFVKTMLKLGAEKTSIKVVDDQYGAPTYAKDLAIAVMDIIHQVQNNPELVSTFNNTYNYANEGFVTWYDIATQIMQEKSLNCVVLPIASKDYPTAAKRPNWSILSKHTIKEKFNLSIPHWYASLKSCLEEADKM